MNTKRIIGSLGAVFMSAALAMNSSAVTFADEVTDGSRVAAARSHSGGYIPSLVDTAPINDADYSGGKLKTDGILKSSGIFKEGTALPATYTTPYSTPVKDQGQYGNCWSFSALASAEGSLLRSGLANVADANLSPFNLVFSAYNKYTFYAPPDDDPALRSDITIDALARGGNDGIATAAMSKGFGPKKWSGDDTALFPRSTPNTTIAPLTSLAQLQSFDWRLTDESVFPSPRDSQGNYSAANVEAVKAAVYNYGPLSTSLDSTNLDGGPGVTNVTHFFKNATVVPKEAGHAVTIVGWDDSIDKSLFYPNIPPANGAFLIKNSWGTSNDNGTVGLADKPGHFWLSYYEGTIGTSAHFAVVSPGDAYTPMFSHDALGALGQSYTFGGNKDQIANRFKMPANSKPVQLSAATVYSTVPGTSYTVAVYKNPAATNPESGRQLDINSGAATTVTKTLATAGFHTIDFSKSVALSAGDTFAIVIQVNKLKADDSVIPYEIKVFPEDAGGAAIIAPGESFAVDEYGNWIDFIDITKDAAKRNITAGNINIKGVARPTALKSLSLKSSSTVLWGQGAAKPVNDTLLNASFTTGFSDTIAIGDGGVKVTGVNTKKLGTYNATATYQGKSVKFKVKVVGKESLRTPLNTVHIAKGKSYNLPVVFSTGNSVVKQKLAFESSDNSVLEVSATGKLTASKYVKKTTKATVTISAPSGLKKTVTVYVAPKGSALKKISVSGAAAKMKKGTYKVLSVKLNPASATGVSVTYSSSKAKVLSVDKAGKVLAKAKGTAKITVKAGNKKWAKQITVK